MRVAVSVADCCNVADSEKEVDRVVEFSGTLRVAVTETVSEGLSDFVFENDTERDGTLENDVDIDKEAIELGLGESVCGSVGEYDLVSMRVGETRCLVMVARYVQDSVNETCCDDVSVTESDGVLRNFVIVAREGDMERDAVGVTEALSVLT